MIEDNPVLQVIEGVLFGATQMTIRNNPSLAPGRWLENHRCVQCDCGNRDQPPCTDGGVLDDDGGPPDDGGMAGEGDGGGMASDGDGGAALDAG